MTDGLGDLIGRGREAEVYAWKDGQVLKLFIRSMPREAVERQAWMAGIASEAGVATPAVIETVEIDGRQGIVFERVEGPSMLARLAAGPWRFGKLARQMAELQVAIHDCRAPELDSPRGSVTEAIHRAETLDAGIKETILRRLEALSEGDRLCHGDFHPDNVILSAGGAVIIDWSNGFVGNPLADVARTWLLSRMAVPPPGTNLANRLMIAVFRAVFYRIYLKRYRQLRPFTDEELGAWKAPMVAIRLAMEDIPEERRGLTDYLERALDGRESG